MKGINAKSDFTLADKKGKILKWRRDIRFGYPGNQRRWNFYKLLSLVAWSLALLVIIFSYRITLKLTQNKSSSFKDGKPYMEKKEIIDLPLLQLSKSEWMLAAHSMMEGINETQRVRKND